MSFFSNVSKWSIGGNQVSYAFEDLAGELMARRPLQLYNPQTFHYEMTSTGIFRGACYYCLTDLPSHARRLDCYLPDIYELACGESSAPFLQELWEMGCGKYILEQEVYVENVPEEALSLRPEARFIRVSFNLDVIPAHLGMLILNFYRIIQEFPQILHTYYWLKEKHPDKLPDHNLFAAFALHLPEEDGYRNSNHMAVPQQNLKVKESLAEIFQKVMDMNLPSWNKDPFYTRVKFLNSNWEGVGNSSSSTYSEKLYNEIFTKVEHEHII